ncbi:DarT1-associated NADAR antitoxin family protein [Staphylococcus gallinarum]|uniref:DarT1-associated NADAR antitoxin family protein n=1 Tax=Staphylococcus gallinarum TaxID=1293 RepID=UPI0024436CFE|nr:hypothetical protein [Staphylococcus gallinarum]MEB7038674.1 hypothetical protein [Staphylococcus gallinarum]
MANRFVYYVDPKNYIYKKIDISFKWYPGFSKEQKQKSIEDLHFQFLKENITDQILEVSSKSVKVIGVKSSAFNLKISTMNGNVFSVEQLFQSSKVYQKAGNQNYLLEKGYNAKEMKQKIRKIDNNDYMTKYSSFGHDFPLEPKNLFYNWLYVNALYRNPDIASEILKYEAFTDIEFNPKRSFNCQAEACAIYVSLFKREYLQKALKSVDNFKKIVY